MIQRQVALLRCGEGQASALLLTSRVAVTARHAVIDHTDDPNNEIQLVLADGTQLVADLLRGVAIPESEDLIFLQLQRDVEGAGVELSATHMPIGVEWTAFGFPSSRTSNGAWIRGTVANWLPGGTTPGDVELGVDDFRAIRNYKGFSGSPVLVNGRVTAILQKQLDGVLAAISVLRIRRYLDLAAIPYVTADNVERLPPGLREAAENSAPNTRTFWAIENALDAVQDGYLVLEGTPGSGKTLIAASFRPVDKRKHYVGTYFAAGDGDVQRLTVHYYRNVGTFARWLATTAALLTSSAQPSSARDTDVAHTASIAANLQALSEYFRARGQRGVLVLDDVHGTDAAPLDALIRALPHSPPRGLLVVLSTVSVAALRSAAPDLAIAKTVEVSPLEQVDCERIVHRSIPEGITAAAGSRLAAGSGGNPLILSYLIRQAQVAIANDLALPDTGIGFGGASEAYYEQQWSRISQSDAAMWIMACLARARGHLPKSELPKLLPENLLAALLGALTSTQHLVADEDEGLVLFHQSFAEFVTVKTAVLNEVIHGRFAQYCVSQSSRYAIANVVHHHLLGGTEHRSRALQVCTQSWIDAAAIQCAPPAYVLDDIARVLSIVVSAGDFVATIRCLLLRSRARFRYERVLGSTGHAAELASVALSLRGPRASLDFVLRNQQLVCSDQEAVNLIRRLLLHGAHRYAVMLFIALRERCIAAYESGFPPSVLSAHIEALGTLLLDLGPTWQIELKRVYRFLDAIKDQLDRNAELIYAQIAGLTSAANLWRFGWFCYSVRHRDSNPRRYATELSLIVGHAHQVTWLHGETDTELTPPPPTDVFRIFSAVDAAEEIEDRARVNGVLPGSERIVAEVLARHGRSPELVGTIATAFLSDEMEVAFRAQNGVDANHEVLLQLMFARMASRYSGEEGLLRRLRMSTRHEWERRFLDAYAWLGDAWGRCYRRRRDTSTAQSSLADALVTEFLPLLTFSLADRAGWEDSYNLPESVVPVLLARLGELIAVFEPSAAQAVASALLLRIEDQLGLYTEGCRRALDQLADALVFAAPNEARTIRLSLHRHIEACTRNRRERVPAFLMCAIGAADAGDAELAEKSFSAAVASSVGPDWYKEDQFTLLVDPLRVADDQALTRQKWPSVVELLERASGELTFQRFVRYEKEALIRHLSKVGLLAEAVQLLRHYLWPDASTQEGRIVSASADHVSRLRGGRFGVMEIDEQAGVLALLNGMTEASPSRRWALVELFLPGDERYFRDFAKVTCDLLSGPFAEEVRERLFLLLKTDFPFEKRRQFLSELRGQNATLVAQLIEEAKRFDWYEEPPPASPAAPPASPNEILNVVDAPAKSAQSRKFDLFLPGTFGRDEGRDALQKLLVVATKALEAGDTGRARTLFVSGLQSAQNASWGIWARDPNYVRAFEGVLLHTGSLESGLAALAEIICGEQYAEDWSIANSLIACVIPGHRDLAPAVLREVFQHIRVMLAPELTNDVAYELGPIAATTQRLAPNDAIEAVLVSALDHPNQHQRSRVAATIHWLRGSGFDPRKLAARIRNHQDFDVGREIAVGILHAWSLVDSTGIGSILSEDGTLETLLGDPNAAVRYGAKQIAAACGVKAAAEIASIEQVETNNPLAWDWGFDTTPILNTAKDSRSKANKWLIKLCEPRTPTDVLELVQLKRRAFDARYEYWSSGVEREACFRAVGDLPDEQLRRLAEEVMWNPLWPDKDIDAHGTSYADPIVERIVERIKDGQLEDCFSISGQLVLHCREYELDAKTYRIREVEVVAVLASSAVSNARINRKRMTLMRSVHGTEPTPAEVIIRPTEPAIIRFEDRMPRVGGGMTPALPSPRLQEVTRYGAGDFRRSVWRDGRIWEAYGVGPSLRGGTALSMRPSEALRVSGCDLVWCVLINRQLAYVVDPARQRFYSMENQ